MAIYIDDRELVAAHRAGDSGAFDELVREHRRSLLIHAKNKLRCESASEDALQETLVRAYKALPNFKGDYRLGPWLHRIMHNVCIDEANRRRREGEKADKYLSERVWQDEAPSVEDELNMHFDDAALRAALDGLSEPYKEALELRFVEDYDYSELAAVTGVSEENARARVSRARLVMRSALKGVAFLPVTLMVLLRRGEKAAAAATSASGAVVASTGSSVASASIPALAEAGAAAAQVAPAAVPIVAKAAVGLGLAAAVLTPTNDSAVHQAVESFANSTTGVMVEEALVSSDSDMLEIQVADGAVMTPRSSDGFAPIETESPDESSNLVVSSETEVSSQDSGVEMAVSERNSGASLTSSNFALIPVGGDRYSLSGEALLSGESESLGRIAEASWFRIEPELNTDGGYRMDGLILVELAGEETLQLRLAGFAIENSNAIELSGLFLSDHKSLKLVERGSFTGSIPVESEPGSATFIFAP